MNYKEAILHNNLNMAHKRDLNGLYRDNATTNERKIERKWKNGGFHKQ